MTLVDQKRTDDIQIRVGQKHKIIYFIDFLFWDLILRDERKLHFLIFHLTELTYLSCMSIFDLRLWSILTKGSSINDVTQFWTFFDLPLPIVKLFHYWGLCTVVTKFWTLSPLWMTSKRYNNIHVTCQWDLNFLLKLLKPFFMISVWPIDEPLYKKIFRLSLNLILQFSRKNKRKSKSIVIALWLLQQFIFLRKK